MFTVGMIRAPPPSLRSEVRKSTMEFFSRGFQTLWLADAWRHSWSHRNESLFTFVSVSFFTATRSSAAFTESSALRVSCRVTEIIQQLNRYVTESWRTLCKHTNSFLNSTGAWKVSKHYNSAQLHTTGQMFYSTSRQIIHERRASFVKTSMSFTYSTGSVKVTPVLFLMKATNDSLYYDSTFIMN